MSRMIKFVVAFCILLNIVFASDNQALDDLTSRAIKVILSSPEAELLQNHTFVNEFFDVLHRPYEGEVFEIPREFAGRHKRLTLAGSYSLAHVALAVRKHKLFATIVAVCEKAKDTHPECADMSDDDLPQSMMPPTDSVWFPKNYVERLYYAIRLGDVLLARLPLLSLPAILGDATGIRAVAAHGHRAALPDTVHAKFDALSLASALGTATTVAVLLAPPINAPIDDDKRRHLSSGEHPVLIAAIEGRIGPLRALLEAGADPDYQAVGRGDSPLHAAAQKGHLKMVKMLVEEFDATVDLPNDKDQHTPYSLAEHFENKDVLSYLRAVYKSRGMPFPTPLDEDSLMQDSMFRAHSAMMLRRRRREAAAAAGEDPMSADLQLTEEENAEIARLEAESAAKEKAREEARQKRGGTGSDDDDDDDEEENREEEEEEAKLDSDGIPIPSRRRRRSAVNMTPIGVDVPPLPRRTPTSQRRGLLSRVIEMHMRRAQELKYQRMVAEADAKFHDEVRRGIRDADDPIPTMVPDANMLALTEAEREAVLQSGPVRDLREKIEMMDKMELETGRAPSLVVQGMPGLDDGVDAPEATPSTEEGSVLDRVRPGVVSVDEYLKSIGCANVQGSKCSREMAKAKLAKERKDAEAAAAASAEGGNIIFNEVIPGDKDEL